MTTVLQLGWERGSAVRGAEGSYGVNEGIDLPCVTTSVTLLVEPLPLNSCGYLGSFSLPPRVALMFVCLCLHGVLQSLEQSELNLGSSEDESEACCG